MPLPRYAGRPPSPAPPKPLPLWPMLVGPTVGTAIALVPAVSAYLPHSSALTFGFGTGMFVGLIGVLAILRARRQLTPQAPLVAIAALLVLLGLIRMWFF